jgi:hypothetical protein
MDEVEGEGVKRGAEPEGSEAWRPMRVLGSFMPWKRLCILGEQMSLIVLVDLCSVVFEFLGGFFAFHFSTAESEVSRSEVSRSFQVRQRPTSTAQNRFPTSFSQRDTQLLQSV